MGVANCTGIHVRPQKIHWHSPARWHPQIAISVGIEVRRHHAYNREALVINDNILPHNTWIATETSLPQSVPKDQHVIVALGAVLRSQRSTKHGGNFEQRKKVTTRYRTPHPFRMIASIEVDRPSTRCRHVRENMVLCRPIQVISGRDSSAPNSGAPLHQAYIKDAVRFRVRERAQQDCVDYAEDRSRAGDPQCQRDNRDRCEPRALSQNADGVANVLNKSLHVYLATAAGLFA